jgi:hypothetical protein
VPQISTTLQVVEPKVSCNIKAHQPDVPDEIDHCISKSHNKFAGQNGNHNVNFRLVQKIFREGRGKDIPETGG